MSIIDELLSAPNEEEAWEVDSRYAINSNYIDDQGPVEIIGKDIGDMSSQISIQGESMSQYVEFRMPRYYDNIDLSEKTLSIHYEINGAGGEIAPMNVYKSQERIKFGWVLPAAALQTFGPLLVSIWARGYVNAEEYIWKSRTASYVIEKGLMIGSGIPEPDENWYLEFVRQMDAAVAEASLYATRAKQSESSTSSSELNAKTYMEAASTGASTAVQKAGEAFDSASAASNASITAQESATLAMEYRDGAEEYYERTKGISEGLSGRLVPMGTVTFENLPALEDAVSGWMYNISNEFTTTSQFKEGAGKVIPLGSNVFKTTDGYWDVLAGSPVSGVKGSAEATYRSGNVNITPANLGITVVNNTKDENKNVNHSKTSDSTTKAAQDSNGNVIVDTYASKSEASLSGTATGKNPTIQDSTNAPLIYGKFKGYTLQDGEPTPDNPVEINGLAKDGNVEVRTCGKNLINDSAMIGKTGVIDTYHDVKFKPNKTYYFVAKTTSGDGMARGYFGVYLLDKDGKFVVSYINQTGKYVSEFTLTEEQANSIVKCRITANGTQPSDMLVTEVAIAETPEYEPYAETTAAIPTDAPLYEGDYLEVYADGSGKLVRAMAEVVFDGSSDETWLIQRNKDSENTICFRANSNVGAKSGAVICNKLVNTPVANADIEGINNSLGSLNYEFIISINKARLSTLDSAGLNTWLRSNPVTVVYELAEPTETPLTAQQVEQFKKLYTFEPVTNVLCDGEVEMVYFRNNPNGRVAGMLQRQIDSITSALSTEAEES